MATMTAFQLFKYLLAAGVALAADLFLIGVVVLGLIFIFFSFVAPPTDSEPVKDEQEGDRP